MYIVTSVYLLNQGSGHSDVVNSVSWGLENRSLYSGSSDRHVAEWSVESGHCVRWGSHDLLVQSHNLLVGLLVESHDLFVRSHDVVAFSCSKWKADKHAVQCVCCHSNGELLLAAGRNIKLWNLSDHTLIKVANTYLLSLTH